MIIHIVPIMPRRGKLSITPHLQCGVHQANTSQRVGDTRSQKTINRTHLNCFSTARSLVGFVSGGVLFFLIENWKLKVEMNAWMLECVNAWVKILKQTINQSILNSQFSFPSAVLVFPSPPEAKAERSHSERCAKWEQRKLAYSAEPKQRHRKIRHSVKTNPRAAASPSVSACKDSAE